MKQELTTENKAQSANINRAAYLLYMVLVVFQLVTRDYEWALANMGILWFKMFTYWSALI